MRRSHLGLLLVLAATLLAGCTLLGGEDGASSPEDPRLALTPMVTGLDQPLLALPAGDGSGRLFIGEQVGTVRIWQDGHLQGAPFLDLRGEVSTGFEQGLLGLAFPPDFVETQRVYVSYTDPDGTSILARYQVDPTDPNRVLPGSREVLLDLNQPYANHNGGHIAFGPDGHLHYSLGDGGGAGDPLSTGQDPTDLYGSILRLDVAPATGYAVPEDNPFVGEEGRDEVWAYGLRNPWRFTFDPQEGHLWIGDVGQNAWEEVNREPAASSGGLNYGWSVREGDHEFRGGNDEPRGSLEAPVAEYANPEGGCSVVMGPVVRDGNLPGLEGRALYGDFCTGTIWSIDADAPEGSEVVELGTDLSITSFGRDAEGHVLVMDRGGQVLRVDSAGDPNG